METSHKNLRDAGSVWNRVCSRSKVDTILNIKEKSMENWTPKTMGKKGGKNSAKKRLSGKTKQEISEIMRKIRKGLKDGGIVNEEIAKRTFAYLRNSGALLSVIHLIKPLSHI